MYKTFWKGSGKGFHATFQMWRQSRMTVKAVNVKKKEVRKKSVEACRIAHS
jgi:hypothetical protein